MHDSSSISSILQTRVHVDDHYLYLWATKLYGLIEAPPCTFIQYSCSRAMAVVKHTPTKERVQQNQCLTFSRQFLSGDIYIFPTS